MKNCKALHVAVGVIKDFAGNILIALRPDCVHQGGLWEFPGGKVEPGESVEQALCRELTEELGIIISELQPLIKIRHRYEDLTVYLDVWTVTKFSGKPAGCEQQEIRWVKPEQLTDFAFPKANYPIINAVRLPMEYAILNGMNVDVLLHDLKIMLENGVKLIQARIKSLSALEVISFFQLAIPLCKENGTQLLINSAVKNSQKIDVTGIHLTTRDLLMQNQRPGGYQWVAASCHNLAELQQAEKIGVDFVVLAPVLETKTHPGIVPLGWKCFEALVDKSNLPVYALGGMMKHDQFTAIMAGAQGIAGISAFLTERSE